MLRNLRFPLFFRNWAAVSFAALALWYLALAAHPIALTSADLGRHLTNGKFLFREPSLLRLNTYSYTFPDFPVVNHHWGSGLVFHGIERWLGFAGLSVFFLLLNVSALYFLFRAAIREAGLGPASVATLLAVPVLAYRTEVRPEAFSVFFCALFYSLLTRWRSEQNHRALYWLPVLMIAWVNLHIYFAFGLLLLALFAGAELLPGGSREKFRRLLAVLVFSALACLLNPLGFQLTFAPLSIFENYGYMLLENQSLPFLWYRGIHLPYLGMALLLYALAFGSLVAPIFSAEARSQGRLGFVCVFFGGLSALAVRNLSLFGLFSIPLVAEGLRYAASYFPAGRKGAAFAAGLGFAALLNLSFVNAVGFPRPGWGLEANVNASAEFFREQGLRGPVFNNYDIGGYLIHHLYPQENVFVDNRPEAYPAEFFRETYIPMQESDEKWRETQGIYGFNVIYFAWGDLTPWGQSFLVRRVQDREWVPVFADDFALIFLKNSPLNRGVIEKFAIPRDRFTTR